jgi:hypothetical protein
MLNLSLGVEGYPLAEKSQPTLAKNANTYYEGASKLATDEKVKEEALVKKAIARRLKMEMIETLGKLFGQDLSKVYGVLDEAVVDGLLTSEWLKGEHIILSDM